MKTIAFVTQKGGSGKSTLAINLAVAAVERGASVAILETDRQATISDWAKLRNGAPPEVVEIDASEIDAALARCAARGLDLVFIDTPGLAGRTMEAAISAADLCIVPARPTAVDLRAVRGTLGAIYRLEKRFAFVLNQTPSRSYRTREAADSLVAFGVLPDVDIGMRNDHQDALGLGQGVTELNPEGPAAHEIRRLWMWIAARLDLEAPRHVRYAPANEAEIRAA